MNDMIYVSSTMWRIKNQPSNSTSCNDNTLRLLVLVVGRYIENFTCHLHFNLGLRFEGLFWERYILKGQIAFKGHWRLQYWTLLKSHEDPHLFSLCRQKGIKHQKAKKAPPSLGCKWSVMWGKKYKYMVLEGPRLL